MESKQINRPKQNSRASRSSTKPKRSVKKPGYLHRKLQVSKITDPEEREADAVAATVKRSRGTEPPQNGENLVPKPALARTLYPSLLSRQLEEEEEPVQAKLYRAEEEEAQTQLINRQEEEEEEKRSLN